MAKLIDQDYETKSQQEFIDENEDAQIDFRTNSLPVKQYNAERKLVEKYILVRMDEMGLDINRADYILQNIDDDDFPLENENLILQRVIQAYLLMEQYRQVTSKQQQTLLLNEIKEIIGKASPNFITYLEKRKSSNSQKQSFLYDDLLVTQCQICFEDLKEDAIKLHCEHKFCQNCMKHYLTDRIITGQIEILIIDNIGYPCPCPQNGCDKNLSDIQVQQIVEEELFDKLKKFRKIKQLQQDPNIIWCPRAGCEGVLRKDENKKLQCQCGQLICKKCGREKHKGQTCSEQLDRNFKKAIKKLKIQNCDRCKSPIQKNDGCNHMTCKQCKYEFCWLCRSKFTYRHYSSYNLFGCPGMQFTHRDPFKYPNLYRFIAIILILILGPPLFVVGLIVGFVVVVIGLPVIIYMNYVPSYVFDEYGCCHKTCIIITFIILCPLVSPISLLLVLLGIAATIILGIPYLIYLFIDWLRYR